MHITEILSLENCGRTTIDGVEYVVYFDGAYRHVIHAEDWDRDITDGQFTGPDGYTEWCNTTSGPDDETAIAVGRSLDLHYVHSLDGTCSRLDCEPVRYNLYNLTSNEGFSFEINANGEAEKVIQVNGASDVWPDDDDPMPECLPIPGHSKVCEAYRKWADMEYIDPTLMHSIIAD